MSSYNNRDNNNRFRTNRYNNDRRDGTGSSYGSGSGSGYNDRRDGYGSGYNDRDNRTRFKNIRRNDDRPQKSQQENEEKFNYAALAKELMENDDIMCSEEVLTDACDKFENMGPNNELKEDLLLGIVALGYLEPSRIQSYAIPQIINGRDILAQSQSGTGKTAAFVISALEKVDSNLNAPQVIILSPTSELATQTLVVGKSLSVRMKDIKFSYTVGGTDAVSNIRELGGVIQGKTDDKVAQIIIATPGRLIHIMKDHPQLFEHIKLLVVDECDELLSGSFKEEIKKILECLSENVQICLFSATLNSDVIKLSEKILNNPVQILIKKEKMTLDGIKQTYVEVQHQDDKLKVLIEMLQTIQVPQFIVYVNTKNNAETLKIFLEKDYSVLIINSGMSKYERADIIKKFKQGGYKCLISTDLLSRGIDIQQLSLVINYDLPRSNNLECYIHRIGRTGRYGKAGLSINLVTKYEKDTQNIISLTFKCPILPLKKDFIKDI
jgi:superfamily II DNA/RNA helicase